MDLKVNCKEILELRNTINQIKKLVGGFNIRLDTVEEWLIKVEGKLEKK